MLRDCRPCSAWPIARSALFFRRHFPDLNRESARKLSLVISLTISDLPGYSLGVSANWRASLSSRRKSVSKVGLSEGKLLRGWPERFLWISPPPASTCESSSAIASARASPFCVAVDSRVNLAKCLFTIFKTSIIPAAGVALVLSFVRQCSMWVQEELTGWRNYWRATVRPKAHNSNASICRDTKKDLEKKIC